MDGALWGKENAKAILIDFAEFAKECSVECLKFMTSRVDNVVNILRILHGAEYTSIGVSILACKGDFMHGYTVHWWVYWYSRVLV